MPARTSADHAPRFPNRVKQLREAAGLTQDQLGEQIGVTFSAIGKLERGETRLRIDQVKALARVFHIEEYELFIPLSPEEREALRLLRAADPAMRRRMVAMLRMLVEPPPEDVARVA